MTRWKMTAGTDKIKVCWNKYRRTRHKGEELHSRKEWGHLDPGGEDQDDSTGEESRNKHTQRGKMRLSYFQHILAICLLSL